MSTEKELIIRLKKGDKESFSLLFEQYYPLFLSFTRRLLRNDAACEDVVQNVFLRLWVHKEHLDPDGSLKNYLLVSVRNEIYCYLRSSFNSKREDDAERVCEIQDGKYDGHDEVFAKETQERIVNIVAEMPAKRRQVFQMSRNRNMTNAQIAQDLGISVRTVEKHIQLALEEIRGKLGLSVLLIIYFL